jgi:hypothetical protein
LTAATSVAASRSNLPISASTLADNLRRYSCCLLSWRGISDGDGADQAHERVIQSCGIAQHVAIRLAMDVHQNRFDGRQLCRRCLCLRREFVFAL